MSTAGTHCPIDFCEAGEVTSLHSIPAMETDFIAELPRNSLIDPEEGLETSDQASLFASSPSDHRPL
jgi:hypothetical protein